MESEIRHRQSVRAGIGIVLLLGVVTGSSACRSFPLAPLVTAPRQLRSAETCTAPPPDARLVPPGQRYSGPGFVEPRQALATIPKGTRLEIELAQELSSLKACAGDLFHATLARSLVLDGEAVLTEGTRLTGRVLDVTTGARWSLERGDLTLVLDRIWIEDAGIVVPLTTEPLKVKYGAKAKDYVVGTAMAVVGFTAGTYLACKDNGYCEGSGLFGLAIGGGGWLAYDTPRVRAVVLEPETALAFRLTEDLTIPAR